MVTKSNCRMAKNGYPTQSMSGKTIYNYIQFHMRGELKKLALKDLRQHFLKLRINGLKKPLPMIWGPTVPN